jgi:hypothetical protein
MEFPPDQIEELKAMFPLVAKCDEGNVTFFFMPDAPLPNGTKPARADLLLCPFPRDNYNSRLFFSAKVERASNNGREALNWNANQVRLIERNWFAISWKTPAGLRLAQMVAIHLKAFR